MNSFLLGYLYKESNEVRKPFISSSNKSTDTVPKGDGAIATDPYELPPGTIQTKKGDGPVSTFKNATPKPVESTIPEDNNIIKPVTNTVPNQDSIGSKVKGFIGEQFRLMAAAPKAVDALLKNDTEGVNAALDAKNDNNYTQ